MRPYGLFDIPTVKVASSLTVFPFMDSISHKLDYMGINYYGQVFTALILHHCSSACSRFSRYGILNSLNLLGSGFWCWAEAR